MSTVTRLSREQLYELVWLKPLKVLAEEIGITDVGLANACDRLDVPRPKQGFWAASPQERANLAVPPLPDRPRRLNDDLVLRRRSVAPPTDVEDVLEVAMPQTLSRPHEAVSILRDLAQKHRASDGSVTIPGSRDGAILRVAGTLLGRALRILHGIGRALQERGINLDVAPDGLDGRAYRFVATAGGHRVHIQLVERSIRSKHVMTPDERARQKRYSSLGPPKYDYTPSGRLTLRLEAYPAQLRRTTWVDREQNLVDQHLGEVVLTIQAGLHELKRLAEEQAELRRLREEAERRQKHLRALEEHLLEATYRWRECQAIQEFLDELEAAVGDARTTQFTGWVAWARATATARSPLSDPAKVARAVDPR